jgi:hypothetical protein
MIVNAQFWMVYWGPYWASGLGLSQRNYFNSFMKTVAPSAGFAAMLAEYQEPGYPIGPGGFAGEVLIATSPGSSIDDTAVQSQIASWIGSGVLTAPNANTVYVMLFPQGTDVTSDGETGCGNYFGYHSVAAYAASTFGRYRYVMSSCRTRIVAPTWRLTARLPSTG